ncbi:CHAP domain-containing protein [Falsirhodobacter halotolerans]|uniref:CHAP domain-containing protein n=1 Tax=Falsirhodobacter halotolerans TaxID=1146892 RepID=UPI001FD345D0|nr:CHAP domain-containing protein [Falsirhodobacter halotolerans]MCJ8141281.1 CHAP domain-containing protein [Falsirhodobacter halotolerans]
MIGKRVLGALAALATMVCFGGQTMAAGGANTVQVAYVSPTDMAQATQDAIRVVGGKRRIWCVPFAREVSGIEIKGNASTWWNQAANVYPRGQTPIAGAVLNFRSSNHMPMGHVAVVSEVIDARTIRVVQANWTRNRITTDVVVDVSGDNTWSQVRVENANSFGRVNPAYGFIYRPAAQRVASR